MRAESIMSVYRWDRFAACIGMDPRLFFDYEKTQPVIVPQECRDACEGCPVADSCLREALLYEGFGFRGGTTAGERRKLRKIHSIKMIPYGGELLFDPSKHELMMMETP